VGVKPAGHGFAKDILQGDLRAVGHLQGLALRDPSEPSLQAGLESTGHDLIVGPGAVDQNQVDVEEQQVHEGRDDQQCCRSGKQVTEHMDV